MRARHDLGKFITELSVAQRGVVLSSGRGVCGELVIAQCGVLVSARSVSRRRRGIGAPNKRQIDNVAGLTPRAGIETSTRMGSDQMAAGALQEAETELVTARTVDPGEGVRSAVSAIDVGLTA